MTSSHVFDITHIFLQKNEWNVIQWSGKNVDQYKVVVFLFLFDP